MVLLSCSGTGSGIYAKLANGMARYNGARAFLTRNSSVLRSLARRQQAQYRQVTHRQGSGRMTHQPEVDRPGLRDLLTMRRHVCAGMRELGKPGAGVLPGSQELRIRFDGSFAIARPFIGECDAIEGESGMWPLGERALEGRFGIGPLAAGEHGGTFAFTYGPDVVWRLAIAKRLLLFGCAGEERLGVPGLSLRGDERTAQLERHDGEGLEHGVEESIGHDGELGRSGLRRLRRSHTL